jgi:ABC-type transporter Mla maintaining outer membrane lipid asymmetry ATPase subunit MlaF
VADVVVQLRNVIKDYKSLRPLRVAALDLHQGQTLALCGFDQMTAEILVDLITAAIIPDSGEIVVFGTSTTAIGDRQAWLETLDQFGLLTERAVLVEQFTVEQNLAIPYSLSVEDMAADVRARVAALAEEIGFATSDLHKQSGVLPPIGRLRLRLGRALAMNPKVLLAEHPNATVPPEDAARFGADLKRIVAARGMAALVLTADEDFARTAADHVWVWQPATGTLKSSSGWRRWFS